MMIEIGIEKGKGREIGHLTEIVSAIRGMVLDDMVTLVIVVGMSLIEDVKSIGRKASAFPYLNLRMELHDAYETACQD